MTFEDVLKYFTHENLVKVALYVAEDTGIDENTKLVRQWLKDKITGMQEIPLHRVINYASYYALCVTKNGSFYSAANAIRCAIWHFQERKEEKEREYEKYIGFFLEKSV